MRPPRHNVCRRYKFRTKRAAKKDDSGKLRTFKSKAVARLLLPTARGGRIGGAAVGC